MKKLNLMLICLALAALFATGCSESPPPAAEKKEPEKPAEPVTGRYATYQMLAAARGWAPDVQLLRVNSIGLTEVKASEGKAGAWQAVFVSPSRRRARTYTYSVVNSAGNLRKGVFAGLEESWSGSGKPFLAAALKTDSDEVYKTALGKGADYAKKHPDMPVTFVLELVPRFPDPAWRVIWGESASTSNFSIYVDAMTGKYLQTMR